MERRQELTEFIYLLASRFGALPVIDQTFVLCALLIWAYIFVPVADEVLREMGVRGAGFGSLVFMFITFPLTVLAFFCNCLQSLEVMMVNMGVFSYEMRLPYWQSRFDSWNRFTARWCDLKYLAMEWDEEMAFLSIMLYVALMIVPLLAAARFICSRCGV